MSIKNLLIFLADKLDGSNPSVILHADKPTGELPMSLFDIEEQNEQYLALANGEGSHRGMLTGFLGGVIGLGSIYFAVFFLLNGQYQSAIEIVFSALLLFMVPFFWEVLRPLSLPVLFNRRTREVYFQQADELFYTAWDGIAAVAYQFKMIGPYTGEMRHTSLEILVRCYGDPEKHLLLNLGLPIGKSLELQASFWEYLRSYMNNGPWFDEQGNHSESDSFVKSQLAIARSGESLLKHAWCRIRKEYKENGGKNFLDFSGLVMLSGGVIFGPMYAIQAFVYRIAKRRSRKLWQELVMERLDPNGPITRLTDIEKIYNICTLGAREKNWVSA